MLTPAMTESRTSLPAVIIVNALWTAVMSPPFLNRLPFADETTTGFTAAGISMVGTAGVLRVFAAAIVKPAALVIMKSRRLIFLLISLLGSCSSLTSLGLSFEMSVRKNECA